MPQFPPSAMALLNRWQSMREHGGLPLRDAMTPEVLEPWLGSISVNDLRHEASGRRVFVGLQGELVSRGMRDDFHGRYVDECVPAYALDDAMRPYLMAADENAAVSSVIAPSAAVQRHTFFARLVMPLADRDPSKTAYFLVFTASKGIEERVSGSIYSTWVGSEPDFIHTCQVIGGQSARNDAA